jgi:S-adenosylmethionine:tRNA ribosyltransferase-isomerase
MDDRRWHAADFDYSLPDDLIAQRPPGVRGTSRLLFVDRADQTLVDGAFADLAVRVPPGDVLVLNTTRVRHARFLGSTPAGGRAEVLLVHPAADGSWIAMGSPGRALRPGRRIMLGPQAAIETVEVLDDGLRRVRFVDIDADRAMRQYGRLPLPPYITRSADADDETRYQTVYADREGSVAAPTAGLHFTPELLEQLRRRGVAIATLDLEVGPGTFRPVEGDVAGHRMHTERYTIPATLVDVVAAARARGGHLWAVGTTVVRALEAAAGRDGLRAGTSATDLLITPGYRFRMVDRLITNFHLPRSTLLMLVSAFAGHALTMAAYRHAVEARYRFYSYGDAMCIV